MKKSIFKSKTFWINLLGAVAIVLPQMVEIGFELPTKWVALTMVVVNLALRMMTTKPVGLVDEKH